jgi:two-component system nitrogen regulation sensor histidine kinase NtrY
VSHYLTLVIVTLLTIMSAIWLAFYMAREITTPIRQLAEGTLTVAGGDYDFHIDQKGKDEIGFLVQSFNKMTHDLQASQAELAQALGQLRQSLSEQEAQKRYMEILLKNVAAGVIGVDPEGRVTNINDSAAQLFRVNREEILGKPGRSLLPPGDHQELLEFAAAARRSGRTMEKRIHLTYPDKTLYLLLKTTALKDDAGQNLGMVTVIEDLTELERAQRQAAWREVARSIAHEVKNPLTPIKLAAQRLRRRYLGKIPDDGKVFDECTQIISDQVDEIKNLVNEFSRFARLPHLTLAPHDLNALVQEALTLYQEVQPRITLKFQPDPALPPISLDQEQIKRVLLNLVDNALASIPGTGEITLSVQGEPEAERVRVEVADTGVGIPEHDKGRVFEPYFSTKRGGTGLGLAIVHSIIADHQGQIRVEDNAPSGSRFIIELPMRREDALMQK